MRAPNASESRKESVASSHTSPFKRTNEEKKKHKKKKTQKNDEEKKKSEIKKADRE